MIFITAGTTNHPFERMDKVVTKLASRFPNENIVYQSKSTKFYSKKNLRIFKEIRYPKFKDYIKDTRVVITHGGPATIFLVLKYCKSKPFVIPREKKLAEHVSDHQVYYARFLAKKNFVKIASGDKNVTNLIISYSKDPEPNMYKGNPHQFEDLLAKLDEWINNF